MKNLIYIAFALIMAAFLSYCKSNNGGENDSTADSTVNVVEESFLSPDDVDLNNPIPVAQLKEVVLAWNGKEVTIAGYCDFFFDNGAIGEKVSLKNHPDSTRKMVECTMKQNYTEEFEKTVPVVIKGKIDRDFFGTIIMTDCELISKNEPLVSVGKINPLNITQKPIPVNDFFNAFYG
ncbi:MAG: hypothetical protein ABIJ97_08690, partial [Bacteroidota bacterium]